MALHGARRAAFAVTLLLACGCRGERTPEAPFIAGVVLDAETGAPLRGAEVTAVPPAGRARTDDAGLFRLTDGVRFGVTYRVSATAEGFVGQTAEVTPTLQGHAPVELALAVARFCRSEETRCAAGSEQAVERCGPRGNEWRLEACAEGQICEAGACSAAFSLRVNGSAAGVVLSTPSGILCGASCEKAFAAGTAVELRAMPVGFGSFAGWSGACAGSEPTCTVSMERDQTVGAEFRASGINVRKQGRGNGRVISDPPGIDCGGACESGFAPGAMVTLTATPNGASYLEAWQGACTGTAPTCTVTVDRVLQVTARFALSGIPLTVTREGAGRVTSEPEGVDCGDRCRVEFESGARVTLTAEAAAGSAFAGWGGDCAGTEPACELLLDRARAARAIFEPDYHFRLPADAACTSLLHFDPPEPMIHGCGVGPAATVSGSWAQVTSRTTALGEALETRAASGGEGAIETQRPGPRPPEATVELTVRMRGAGAGGDGRGVLFGDRDFAEPAGAGFRLSVLDDGRLVATTRDASGGTTTASSAPGVLQDGRWAFVATTLSATGGLRVMVDGAEVASAPGPLAWTASSSTAWVGAERAGPGGTVFRFDGAVDEVRVSDVVR